MNKKEIKLFINRLTYDLDTLQYLKDYGRIIETIPTIQKILNNIQNLKEELRNSPYESLFSEKFWKEKADLDLSFHEIRQKIENTTYVDQKALKDIGIINFIEKIYFWTYYNIHQLKVKSRPINYFTILNTIIVLILIIYFGSYLIVNTGFSKNWGLKAHFYEGINFEKLVSSGMSKIIQFENIEEMDLKIPSENASARWEGFLIVPQSGEWTFILEVDDGARLLIDNSLVINTWRNQDKSEHSGTIHLKQGKHTIRLEYYNHLGDSNLNLFWQSPNHKKEIIPYKYYRQQ